MRGAVPQAAQHDVLAHNRLFARTARARVGGHASLALLLARGAKELVLVHGVLLAGQVGAAAGAREVLRVPLQLANRNALVRNGVAARVALGRVQIVEAALAVRVAIFF